jgi:hypothetical protein
MSEKYDYTKHGGTINLDSTIAFDYGLEEAIIFDEFLYQIEGFIRKEKHCYPWLHTVDGKEIKEPRTWVYDSASKLVMKYQFWSESQIRRTLKRMVEKGLIATGCFNKNLYDKTMWYCIVDENKFLRGIESNTIISDDFENIPVKNTQDACDEIVEPCDEIVTSKECNRETNTSNIPLTINSNTITYTHDNSKPSKNESSESRIQKAQSLWNSLDIKPAYNWTSLNRKSEDNTKLLHTLDGFSDELIEQAIHNYKKLIDMPDCDFMKYQSFPGFMYSGVEKFIDDARPFETLVRKKKPDSAKPTVDLSSRTGFSAMRQSTDENLDLLEGL